MYGADACPRFVDVIASATMKSYHAPDTLPLLSVSPVQTTPSRAVLDWTNLHPSTCSSSLPRRRFSWSFPDHSRLRHPGSPRIRSTDHAATGHPYNMLGDLWQREVRRDHRGRTAQRPFLASRLWYDEDDDDEDDDDLAYPGFHIGSI